MLVLLLLALTAPHKPGRAGAVSTPLLSGVEKPRGTYFLWRAELASEVVFLACVEVEDQVLALAAINKSGSYQLLALNASDGSRVASGPESPYRPYGLAAVGQYLAVATEGEGAYLLAVYNSSLRPVYTRKFSTQLGGPWAAPGGLVVLAVNDTLIGFSVDEMRDRWSTVLAGADKLSALPLEEGIAVLWHQGYTWALGLVSPDDGSIRASRGLGLAWASMASLAPYDGNRFLIWAGNSTASYVALVDPEALKPAWEWSGGPISCVLSVEDLDGDGARDIVAISAHGPPTYVIGLSGPDGRELFSAELALRVSSAFWTGRDHVALSTGSGLVLAKISARAGEIEVLWHVACSLARPLPDLDGDGLGEVLVSEGATVACIWGSYDDRPPVVEEVWPPDGFSTAFSHVLLMAKVEDEGSGVSRVVFVVDGREVNATYDSGRYVAYIWLTEGNHTWMVVAHDRAGLSVSYGPLSLVVNTSFFGRPGWHDDVLFFGPCAGVIIALVAYVLRRKGGVGRAPQSPGPT